MDKKNVRCGMHLQTQKIGKSDRNKYEMIEWFKNDSRYQEIKDLNVIGLDLSILQNQAILGIQSLLDKTNYKGNQSPCNHIFPFYENSIELPVLRFSPANFYDACCLQKQLTNSGKNQYRRGDKEQVLEALRSIYHKDFVMTYTEKIWSEKKNIYEKKFVKCYMRLFGDVKEVFKETGDKRLESVTMVMSPIFIAQLDTYNVQKPPDYITQIKIIAPRASKFVHLFIEHVLSQSRVNRNGGTVRLKEETLAYQIRMDNYIKKKELSKIKKVITQCLDIAMKIEFISSYKYENSMVEFKINYNKLTKVNGKF